MPRLPLSRYQQIIERIFMAHYKEGAEEAEFTRDDIVRVARELGITLPKTIGDLVYSFRYRMGLPEAVRAKAPAGKDWIIRAAGTARYRFVAVEQVRVVPNPLLAETKVPDATPGIIAMYALGDEQALLAKVRYNRLVDIFTGVTCHSLQSHIRTTIAGLGQVETDELYVGIDRRGAHYVFPVEAKAANERLGIVQIEQDFALCAAKFPTLICRPIGAQFLNDNVIALFAFEESAGAVAISFEKHYHLVRPAELTAEELRSYRDNLA